MRLMGIEKSNNANLGSMRKALAVMGRDSSRRPWQEAVFTCCGGREAAMKL